MKKYRTEGESVERFAYHSIIQKRMRFLVIDQTTIRIATLLTL